MAMNHLEEAKARAVAVRVGLQLKGKLANPNRWYSVAPSEKQQVLLDGDYHEAFYGGSAGGGKTVLLLMAACKYVDYGNYRALILRRTTAALKEANGLVDISKEFFRGTGARYNERDMRWTFPSGATLRFGFLEHDKHLETYQGGGYSFCGFDELSQFTQAQYTYLFSRLRKNLQSATIPLRIYSTSNPDPAAMWIYDYFIKDASKEGQFAYFKDHLSDDNQKWSTIFVPAKLDDNPGIDKASYLISMARLDPILRKRLLDGDWLVKAAGDIYKLQEPWHVITWTQFASVVGVPHIPLHWRLGLGVDWGATRKSLTGAVWAAKGAKNLEDKNPLLKGAKFLYREKTFHNPIPDDLYNYIIKAESFLNEGKRMDFRIMSHDALTEREILERQYLMPFKQAVHPVKSGIALIQNELRITDTDQPHPFKPDQLMGHPQLYLIVDDAQGQMFPNPDATNLEQPYFMTPAYNEFGLQGLRENMISYRWLDNGDPMHDDSGLLDAVRYIGWRFFPAAAHITQQERQDKDLPFNLRMDNITQQTDVNEINRLMHNRQIQLQVQEYINQAITKSNNRPNKTPVYYRNPSSFRSIKGA